MGFVIAHDVGTSGNKAVLADEQGTIVGSATAAYPTFYPGPDRAEQDAGNWWRAVCTSTRAVLASAGVDPEQIIAITFSTQMLGIVPMGADGAVLRPPIIWLDARAGEEARALMRRFGGPHAFAMVAGAELGAKDGIPKLMWLRRHEPQEYAAMKCFLDIDGYLLYCATGRMVMEATSASVFGTNLKKDRWLTGIMRYAGLDPNKFAPIVASTDVVGGLTDAAAAECGLAPGTPVVAGAGDVPAASIGAGAARPGESHLYLGTSGWVAALTARKPRGKHGMAVIASAAPGVHLLLAEMETAGECLSWIAHELYHDVPTDAAFEAMDSAVARVPAGAHGLLFTPWMYGERVPFQDATVRSAFIGLGVSHTRNDMVRAAYEGVCYHFRLIVESMQHDFGIEMPVLRVVGGGARRDCWMQMLADVTRRSVEVPADPLDAGARGAALIALIGVGAMRGFDEVSSTVQVANRYEPDPTDRYADLYRIFRETYRSLRGVYHHLAAHQAVS
ncbi:MAG: xylulokinase [Actinomycetota bacterium]